MGSTYSSFTTGPLVGGFIADNKGWRWLYWIQLIVAGFIYVLMTFTVPETYAPTILLKRARRLRKETGDPTFVTEQEIDRAPLSDQLTEFIIRPFQLLFRELIVFLLSIYMSVLYGLLYMFFVAYVSGSHCVSVVLLTMSLHKDTRSSTKRVKAGAPAQQGSCSSPSHLASSSARYAPHSSTGTTSNFASSTVGHHHQKRA